MSVFVFVFFFVWNERKEMRKWEVWPAKGDKRYFMMFVWLGIKGVGGWGLRVGQNVTPFFFSFSFFLYKPRASPLSWNPCYTLPFKNLSAICNMSLELSITWQWWNYQFSTLSPKIKLLLHWYLNFPSQLVWNSKKQKPIAKCNTKKKS